MKTRHLILIGLTILLWFSFRFLLPLTLPFVLAYFFAKLVSPMIQFLVNKLKCRKYRFMGRFAEECLKKCAVTATGCWSLRMEAVLII